MLYRLECQKNVMTDDDDDDDVDDDDDDDDDHGCTHIS